MNFDIVFQPIENEINTTEQPENQIATAAHRKLCLVIIAELRQQHQYFTTLVELSNYALNFATNGFLRQLIDAHAYIEAAYEYSQSGGQKNVYIIIAETMHAVAEKAFNLHVASKTDK